MLMSLVVWYSNGFWLAVGTWVIGDLSLTLARHVCAAKTYSGMLNDLRAHAYEMRFEGVSPESLAKRHPKAIISKVSPLRIGAVANRLTFVCVTTTTGSLLSGASAYLVPAGETIVLFPGDEHDLVSVRGIRLFQLLHELGHCTPFGKITRDMMCNTSPVCGAALMMFLLVFGAPLLYAVLACLLWAIIWAYVHFLDQTIELRELNADLFAIANLPDEDLRSTASLIERYPTFLADQRLHDDRWKERREWALACLKGRSKAEMRRTWWEELQMKILFKSIPSVVATVCCVGLALMVVLSGMNLVVNWSGLAIFAGVLVVGVILHAMRYLWPVLFELQMITGIRFGGRLAPWK